MGQLKAWTAAAATIKGEGAEGNLAWLVIWVAHDEPHLEMSCSSASSSLVGNYCYDRHRATVLDSICRGRRGR